MTGFILTRQAEDDLNAIWDHIAADNPAAALGVLDSLESAFADLATTPGIGHYRDDLADRRHRFKLIFSYLIVYRWEAVPLQIIRILHGARDVRSILDSG